MLKLETYTRKPFAVKAIEVTADNIKEVAAWCKGTIEPSDPNEPGAQYRSREFVDVPIKVSPKRPVDERQRRAYHGDWVLYSVTGAGDAGPAGFKVYTPKAFAGSFEKTVEHMMETVQRMEENDRRAEQEAAAEEGTDVVVEEFQLNRPATFSDIPNSSGRV